MADDDHGRLGPGDLQTPFLFVPHGDPPPLDWMARHPGWVKFPATMVPRRPAAWTGTQAHARPTAPLATPIMDTATLGMTAGRAAAIPGVLDAGGLVAAAATPIEIVLAPELVLVLVLVGGYLVWRYVTRERARSLETHPARPPATPMPEQIPADPGLVPPSGVPDRPADAGLPPARPVSDLPGLPQANPLPHVLSTPIPEQTGPTILRHDRNEGLEGGARTNSSRARKAARAADPEVTQALKDDEWRAHHLFAVAVAKRFPGLVAAAVRAGWRMDAPSNMVALPASPDAQTKLWKETRIKRPVHDNRHPEWNDMALEAVRNIEADLENSELARGSREYDQAARRALENAERTFRQSLRKMKRVTRNDQPTSEAQA